MRRCLIPLKNLEENHLIFNGSSIYTRIPKDFLKNSLSRRQWDIIESLDIFIFSHHDKTFGLLLMFNCPVAEDSQFMDFASFFIRKCSELFYNSRSSKICNLPPFPIEPPVTLNEAVNIINENFSIQQKIDSDPVKLIIINYANIIDNIVNKNDSIDRFRIENDIYKMYSSMLFGSSFIIRITESRLLIIFRSGLNSNNMIIKNQICTSLLSLFEEDSVINQPQIIVEEFAAKSTDMLVQIKNFLSDNL